ncbi:hypothetical protein NADRNF5_2084 [Nitrosopumilus adriaticus]|uniref:Uncharacterized protein n=1 Tax=Nitrosopumilus adriaticus TaxID=1580092 RepID=A0A0D5C5U4_9ARCH|nr:hypothetical protein NADRNF5_2084 [Nitrosopumilus adriaticus]
MMKFGNISKDMTLKQRECVIELLYLNKAKLCMNMIYLRKDCLIVDSHWVEEKEDDGSFP